MKIRTYIPRSGASTAFRAGFYESLRDVTTVRELLPFEVIGVKDGWLSINGFDILERTWIVQPAFANTMFFSEEVFKSRFKPLESQGDLFSEREYSNAGPGNAEKER